jgi:hypothetical protein
MPSRFFRLPVNEIGYVRMIVESYDGLATVRSHGSSRGEIEWLIGEGLEGEAAELAVRLGREVGLIPIDKPSDWPSLLPPAGQDGTVR